MKILETEEGKFIIAGGEIPFEFYLDVNCIHRWYSWKEAVQYCSYPTLEKAREACISKLADAEKKFPPRPATGIKVHPLTEGSTKP